MNKQLNGLLQQEMTRKEFLLTLGFGLASIAGLGSLVRFLTGKQSPLQSSHSHKISGYGSSVYGGRQ